MGGPRDPKAGVLPGCATHIWRVMATLRMGYPASPHALTRQEPRSGPARRVPGALVVGFV
jgi:hypothetical protein